MNHDFSIVSRQIATAITENSEELAQQILKNHEQIWLEDFRWYRNKLDVGKPPKSSIL